MHPDMPFFLEGGAPHHGPESKPAYDGDKHFKSISVWKYDAQTLTSLKETISPSMDHPTYRRKCHKLRTIHFHHSS